MYIERYKESSNSLVPYGISKRIQNRQRTWFSTQNNLLPSEEIEWKVQLNVLCIFMFEIKHF